jgi:hypothetical protein
MLYNRKTRKISMVAAYLIGEMYKRTEDKTTFYVDVDSLAHTLRQSMNDEKTVGEIRENVHFNEFEIEEVKGFLNSDRNAIMSTLSKILSEYDKNGLEQMGTTGRGMSKYKIRDRLKKKLDSAKQGAKVYLTAKMMYS